MRVRQRLGGDEKVIEDRILAGDEFAVLVLLADAPGRIDEVQLAADFEGVPAMWPPRHAVWQMDQSRIIDHGVIEIDSRPATDGGRLQPGKFASDS